MSTTPSNEAAHSARLALVETRLTTVETSLGLFRRESDDMRRTINKISSTVEVLANDTAEMVRLFQERKAAFSFFNRMARIIRPVVRFVVLSALGISVAVYAVTHGGETPAWVAKVLKVIE